MTLPDPATDVRTGDLAAAVPAQAVPTDRLIDLTAPDPAHTVAAALRGRVAGAVLLPADEAYAEEVAGFNLAATLRPALVVAAESTADVAAAVRAAADAGLAVSVQATGHGAGLAACDGAVLVSTRRLQTLHVNPVLGTAHVGAGVRWARVIEEASRFGLAGLVGSSPGVSVVGYTLGGGLGPLARRYGLACDRVREIELVTADGEVRRVDASRDPELFWALRGGKGSFGVVTAMTFDLVPVARLYGGGLFYDAADADVVLHLWRTWVDGLDDETTSSVALLNLPPDPALPEPIRGRSVLHVRVAHLGHARDGEELVAPLRAAAPLLMDALGEMPYAEIGRVHSDPEGPLPGHDGGGVLRELPAEAVDALLAAARSLPLAVVELRHLGGAVGRAPAVPNAAAGRHAAFTYLAIGVMVPPIADLVPGAVAALGQALAPWAAEGCLTNFAGAPGRDGFTAAFAAEPGTLARLAAVKAAVDPGDVFRCGQTVAPTPAVPVQPGA